MIKLTVLFVILFVCVLISGLSWVLHGILEAGKDILSSSKEEDKKRLGYIDLLGRIGIASFAVIGVLEISTFYDHYVSKMF